MSQTTTPPSTNEMKEELKTPSDSTVDEMDVEKVTRKRKRESEKDKPKKRPRKLWPQCLDENASWDCLLLKNFSQKQTEMIKSSIEEFIRDIQERDTEDSSDDDDRSDREKSVLSVPFDRCRFLQSEEVKKKQKQAYRADYSKRPEVQQKKAEKEANPETKKKRAEYAKKDGVKKQKKIRTQTRQTVYKFVKQRNPTLFAILEKEALEQAKQKIEVS